MSIVDGIVVTREYLEINNKKMIISRRYELTSTRKGDHIFVRDINGRSYFVNIEKLYSGDIDEPKPIDTKLFSTAPNENRFRNYLKLFGQELMLQNGDDFIALQPLTEQQVLDLYENTSHYPEVSLNVADYMQPHCFRKAENGAFVAELDLQPICYDYALNNSNFDAYLFSIQFSSGVQCVVVDKKNFKSENSSLTISLNGVKFRVNKHNNIQKLVRVNKSVYDCAVMQTTLIDGEKFNTAVVLRQQNKDYNLDDVTDEFKTYIDNLVEQFRREYKLGKYKLRDFYLDTGERVKLADENHYTFEDYLIVDDLASANKVYDLFQTAKMELDNGKFNGEPTYNKQKAIKNYKTSAKKFAGDCFRILNTTAGFLLLPLTPVLALCSLGALISIPFNKMDNSRREKQSQSGITSKVINPHTLNRDLAKEHALMQLKQVLECAQKQFKKIKTKQAELTNSQVESLLQNLYEIKNELQLNLSFLSIVGDFHVQDAEAKITPQNAYLARQFEDIYAKCVATISNLQHEYTDADLAGKEVIKKELSKTIASRDVIKENFISMHDDYAQDNKTADLLCGFIELCSVLIVSKYKIYAYLTAEQKNFVDKLEIDFKSGQICFNVAKYNSLEEFVSVNGGVYNSIKDYIRNLGYQMVDNFHFMFASDGMLLPEQPANLPEQNLYENNQQEGQVKAQTEAIEPVNNVDTPSEYFENNEPNNYAENLQQGGYETQPVATEQQGYVAEQPYYEQNANQAIAQTDEIDKAYNSQFETEPTLDGQTTNIVNSIESEPNETTEQQTAIYDNAQESVQPSAQIVENAEPEHTSNLNQTFEPEQDDDIEKLFESMLEISTDKAPASETAKLETTKTNYIPVEQTETDKQIDVKPVETKNLSTKILANLYHNKAKANARDMTFENAYSVLKYGDLTSADLDFVRKIIQPFNNQIAKDKNKARNFAMFYLWQMNVKLKTVENLLGKTKQVYSSLCNENVTIQKMFALQKLLYKNIPFEKAKNVVEAVENYQQNLLKTQAEIYAEILDVNKSIKNILRNNALSSTEIEIVKTASEQIKQNISIIASDVEVIKSNKMLKWRNNFIKGQNILIGNLQKANKTLMLLLNNANVITVRVDALKSKQNASPNYFAKEVCLTKKHLDNCVNALANYVDSVEFRLAKTILSTENLNLLNLVLAGEIDHKLIKAQNYCKLKTKILNLQKRELELIKKTATDLKNELENIKAYVDVVKAELTVSKILSSTKLSPNLQPTDDNLRLLTKAVVCVKNTTKRLNLVAKQQMEINRWATQHLDVLKRELPNKLTKVQNFVYVNQSIYMQNKNNNLKAVCLKKLKNYDQYDSRVKFN